jgi:hypothetical protein
MSKLPLEVHEVLEEEYVSMYGPLEVPSSDYTTDDIIDDRWARAVLEGCKVDVSAGVIAALNALVAKGALESLQGSPAITDCGIDLIINYNDYTDGVSEVRRREINRRIVDDALHGAVKNLRDLRLAALYSKLHLRPDDKARTALSISGGGIRTATFALGVIQGLSTARILDKFDYLSTVSGGGYIGSWLSSWARRHPSGISGVQEDLIRADNAVEGTKPDICKTDLPHSKIDPEPRPIRHLREYSNYLSPQLGFTSGDTWTMASLYVRNLTLNLLVLVPLLAALLAIPRLFSLLLSHDVAYRQPVLLTVMLSALAVGFGFLGLTRPTVHGRHASTKFFRWISTNGGFLVCVFALVVAGAALSLYWAQAATEPWSTIKADWPWALGALGAMTLLPFLIYYGRYWQTTAVERHERVRGQSIGKKLFVEFCGTVVGVATAALLFYLLAHKVFDDPRLAVPDLTTVPPFLRGLMSDVPMSELYVCFSVPLVLLIFFAQATAFVGVSSKYNEDYDREWWGRAGAWLLMAAVLLALGSAISVFGPVFLYRAPLLLSSIGGVSGVIAAMVGFSAKTPASEKEKDKPSKTAAIGNLAAAFAVPLFVIVLLASISLGTTVLIQLIRGDKVSVTTKWAEQFQSNATFTQTAETAPGSKLVTKYETEKTPYLSIATVNGTEHLKNIHDTDWTILGCIALVAAGAFLLSFFIGVNRFSMHSLYRNRIIRAYLGASRYHREPDTFTGFDPHDNLQMYELHPDLIWPTSFTDAALFVKQLQENFTKADSVEQTIWNALDKQTRIWIEEGHAVDVNLTNSLIQDLNRILVKEKFAEIEGIDSRAARMRANREVLTATFDSLQPRQRAPLHIINAALNLTAGEKLAWQQRKAESFTVSPLHSGSFFVGYRDSREYGGRDGISIGTAVTISGAAASPNQGYHSSPAMAFLLTLLNVRLGSWLGNPGIAGEDSYRKANPSSNLHPLALELTGTSNDQSRLVYLSDGGHFENLALYEMVLRRCRYIVVSDGGCDPTFNFEDLGNAIRKIRTDLGVPIDIRHMYMFPRKAGEAFPEGRYVAVARIRYSAIDKKPDGVKDIDGTLVYVKPALYSENYFPKDVYNYALSSADFPHETTADQFFSESQFESYRALGRHVVNEICGNYDEKAKNPEPPMATLFNTVAEFAAAVESKAQRDETFDIKIDKATAATLAPTVTVQATPNARLVFRD